MFEATISSECYGRIYKAALHICLKSSGESIKHDIDYNRVIGLDYTQNGLYVDSDKNEGKYPGFRQKAEKELKRHYAAAKRFHYGSRRWKKHMARAESLEEHVSNQRQDWQYKDAHRLADDYDAVGVETLDYAEMKANNPALTRKMNDNANASFHRILKNVFNAEGKPFVMVDKYFPSSQICSECGHRVNGFPLSEPTFVCPECGHTEDRDTNSAGSIRRETVRILAA